MQVTVIGVRSQRATWISSTFLALTALITSLFMPSIGGLNLASVACAQDRAPLGSAGRADANVANSTAPVLVVSIASLNKLMQDVNYISAAAGQPQAGGMFTMMAGGFAQGLDMSRPIGVIVPIVDGAPEPIAMVPTPDVETMLKRLEAQTGPIDRLDDGTLVVAAGPALVYIRQVGPWAIVARQKELLDLAPANPMSLLEDLGDNYTLSARLNVKEIPAGAREDLIAQIRQGFESAMAKQGQDGEGLQAASNDSIGQIEQLIRESAELMVGININPTEKIVTLESKFIAADGTEMAEMYAGQKAIPSKFASVIDDKNAMYYHAAASIGPKVIERTRESIDSAKLMISKAIEDSDELDDEAKGQVNELSNAVIKLIMQTIEEGKFDIGVQSIADDGQLELAAGMFVSDGDAAAQLAKDLADKLKGTPDAPTFVFGEETYNGVTLHSVKVAIPAKEAELRQMFGPEAIIKIGTAPKAVYLALSADSANSIKSFIDQGMETDDPADRPLGQMQVSLLPYLRLAQSIKPNDLVASMIDTLSQNADTDYVALQSNVIENGQTSYFEIGEGILKAVGAAVRELQMQRMRQMQQGGGQF
jgi:hypothetical protein